MNTPAPASSPLDSEEYIEQAYFFRVYRERLEQNIPAQEVLEGIHEEVLSTSKLPMALQFLRGEILHSGRIGEAMGRLPHYFSPFQAYVMSKSEDHRTRFDMKMALEILEREANYRAHHVTSAGLFIYQFECLSRNKLGFDRGMEAMAGDPQYSADWRNWILWTRLQLGSIDFTDLIYRRSEQAVLDQRRLTRNPDFEANVPILFGAKEGRIARANRGKDPLFMFAALQRQLGYPPVPRHKRDASTDPLSPVALQAKLVQLEKRISLIDAELKGNLDISDYYSAPNGMLPKFPESEGFRAPELPDDMDDLLGKSEPNKW